MRAKTAGASKTYETEVDKPLGLTLGQNPGGRVVITVWRHRHLYCIMTFLSSLLGSNANGLSLR